MSDVTGQPSPNREGSEDLWPEFEATPPCDPATAPPAWRVLGTTSGGFIDPGSPRPRRDVPEAPE